MMAYSIPDYSPEKLVERLLILISWWDAHTLGHYCIYSLEFSTASV